MKRFGKYMGLGLICAAYVAVGIIIAFMVSQSSVYPSGTDTMCHIYKGDVLYNQIKEGNFYPLFDSMWYNGVEMLRYWAPLPVYFLAMCQGIMGGSYFNGYLLFLAIVYVAGALSWLVIGVRHKRPWFGAFIGFLWFFMPNNLLAIFVEGNLPRALCMIVLPLFVSYVHDYLLEDRWSSLPKMIISFMLMTLCHLGYAGMIALGLIIFLIVYRILYRQRRKIIHILISVVLGMLLTGIWAYASLQGGISNTDSSQVMKGFFQDALVSLNPILRITEGQGYFYFGLAAFILVVFGSIFARRKSLPGFWTALIIFICTTSTMYAVLVKLPGSQYLWMLRFISIALCFALYSFFIWDSLKKPFICVLSILLVLDVIPSLPLITGDMQGVTAEERYDTMGETTLISEAKEITSQRMALLDLSTLGSDGAYLVSRGEDGVPGVFGAGWQSASTAMNISRLNESLEYGHYLYLFDRSIEMGSDTIVIRVSQAQGREDDISAIDTAADRLGYELVDENSDYRLYHKDVPESFGVKSKYSAIGIGTSASLMALTFPLVEETTDTNLNHYTYEELSQYKTIYLAGFTCDDREAAENMILKLTRDGVKVVILADGIPVDRETGLQKFAGVICQSITFSNGYPQLDTIDGTLNPDLFPDGYTNWKTVYMNGLDDVWGTTLDLDQQLDFMGTKDNDNLVFVGLNLTYHYALTQDEKIGALLSKALDIEGDELPEREIVALDVNYGRNEIEIESPSDDVNTTIAYHDNYSGSQEIYSKNNLTYVNRGSTVIKMSYPYLYEGMAVSGLALVLTVVFLILTRRNADKKAKACQLDIEK